MRRIIAVSISTFLMFVCGVALAGYNPVHKADPQFAQCLAESANDARGGPEGGAISTTWGVAASCGCVWNETRADFKGKPGSFAGTPRRAAMNRTCGAIYLREVKNS